ncbi:hypothetical protein C8R44DRAFT_751728 [Mycena epipterygia]|nr:hypothetical protein C8R44DRAFT_751728 [Mycena epipterygia]
MIGNKENLNPDIVESLNFDSPHVPPTIPVAGEGPASDRPALIGPPTKHRMKLRGAVAYTRKPQPFQKSEKHKRWPLTAPTAPPAQGTSATASRFAAEVGSLYPVSHWSRLTTLRPRNTAPDPDLQNHSFGDKSRSEACIQEKSPSSSEVETATGSLISAGGSPVSEEVENPHVPDGRRSLKLSVSDLIANVTDETLSELLKKYSFQGDTKTPSLPVHKHIVLDPSLMRFSDIVGTLVTMALDHCRKQPHESVMPIEKWVKKAIKRTHLPFGDNEEKELYSWLAKNLPRIVKRLAEDFLTGENITFEHRLTYTFEVDGYKIILTACADAISNSTVGTIIREFKMVVRVEFLARDKIQVVHYALIWAKRENLELLPRGFVINARDGHKIEVGGSIKNAEQLLAALVRMHPTFRTKHPLPS